MKYGLIFACLVTVVTVLVSRQWQAIDADNNAFAKACNDRGGKAEFTFAARQCIGATPKKGTAS